MNTRWNALRHTCQAGYYWLQCSMTKLNSFHFFPNPGHFRKADLMNFAWHNVQWSVPLETLLIELSSARHAVNTFTWPTATYVLLTHTHTHNLSADQSNNPLLNYTRAHRYKKNLPSLIWHGWMVVKNGILSVENWLTRCWHGCLSQATCKYLRMIELIICCFTKIHSSSPFWYWITKVVLLLV